MGSLTPGGLPITQATNVLRHSHNSNYVRQSDITDDSETRISNSGVVRIKNLPRPHGVSFEPGEQRVFVSGLQLNRRELEWNPVANTSNGIRNLEFNKFINSSGNLQHIVTRAMGIHVSITDKESPNVASGPMVARTERKVFFIDSDRGKSSGFAKWQIFDASGCPVGTTQGITEVDVTPEPTFDNPC